MNKFIWIKDRNGRQHYVNSDHIVRVTKVPPSDSNIKKTSGYAYIRTINNEDFELVMEPGFDTFEDIVTKIQQAQA